MKKQELLHLHGLLAEISNYYEEHTDTAITYDVYDDLGVRPTAIHKSKTDHKAAVFALADELTSAMESTDLAGLDDTTVPSPTIGESDYPTKVTETVDSLVEEYDRDTVTAVVNELYTIAESDIAGDREELYGTVADSTGVTEDDISYIDAELNEVGIFGNPFVPAYIREEDPNAYFDDPVQGGTAAD